MNRVTPALAALLGCLALAAAPSAPRRARWLPVESDGLRLTIRPARTTLAYQEYQTWMDDKSKHEADVILHNLTNRDRAVNLRTRTGGIDFWTGITYVIRFPGGETAEFSTIGYTDDPPRKLLKSVQPLGVPGAGSLRSKVGLYPKPEGFAKLFEKYDGKFCLSAVVGWLNLQSNLVCYNDCPEPPRDYRPLDHTQFKPEKWRGVDVEKWEEKEHGRVLFRAQLYWMRELNKKR